MRQVWKLIYSSSYIFVMGDVERSIQILEELKRKNIGCSIDNFGTSCSSLTYLKKLSANLIKIERASVKEVHQGNDVYFIAKMIIGLGRGLNMDIIAEGVETQDQLDCVVNLGRHKYQRYYFC